MFSVALSVALGLSTCCARPLAGILLYGARTFLHAHEAHSGCLADFHFHYPLHSIVFQCVAKLPTDAPRWQVDAMIYTLGTTIRKAGSRQAFAAIARALLGRAAR
jgi:hypothetical protein